MNAPAVSPVLDRGESRYPGFALATVAPPGQRPAPALVLGDDVIDLRGAARAAGVILAPERGPGFDLLDLLQDWARSCAAIDRVAAFVQAAGTSDIRVAPLMYRDPATRVLPPIQRPSKLIHAAQNYPDHVQEMRAARTRGFNSTPIDEAQDFRGDREGTWPYLFLKAPSALAGAYDDIVMPPEVTQLDWEVELAVVIGHRTARVTADEAMSHVAGFMTTNDLSARNLLFRPDRERLRSDWFAGKSHDGFAPTGPLFVPAQFVPDHLNLRLRLWVNGGIRQDGNTRHLIFSPAEQIEYASRIMTLEPGDVLATGTPGGVGQGTGQFLASGDVVEAEVEGLGLLRNRVHE